MPPTYNGDRADLASRPRLDLRVGRRGRCAARRAARLPRLLHDLPRLRRRGLPPHLAAGLRARRDPLRRGVLAVRPGVLPTRDAAVSRGPSRASPTRTGARWPWASWSRRRSCAPWPSGGSAATGWSALAGEVLVIQTLVVSRAEPLHPGAVLALLLAALVLAASFLDGARWRQAAGVVGVLLAAMLLIKINVGLFAAVGVAGALATVGNAAAARRGPGGGRRSCRWR